MNSSWFRNSVLLASWCVGVGLIYVPIVTLIAYSFFSGGGTGFSGSANLSAYRDLLKNQVMISALGTSLQIAIICASLATVLGGLGAIAAERAGRSRVESSRVFPISLAAKILGGTLTVITMLPLLLPEIIFGLGLLVWFVILRVTLGELSLILAHVTFSVSYVFMTVSARFSLFDPSVEDAAADLGAGAWQILTKVYVPMLGPALIAGWLMAFTLSFDDFLISFFTSGSDTETLPIALYNSIKFGVTPSIFAMSSLIFGVSFVTACLLARLAVSNERRPSRASRAG